MKRFISALLIIFVISTINLPNYIKPEKVYAISKETDGDKVIRIQKELQVVLTLLSDYNKISNSNSYLAKLRKESLQKTINSKINKLNKEMKNVVVPKAVSTINNAVNIYIKFYNFILELDRFLDETVSDMKAYNAKLTKMNNDLNKVNKNLDKTNKNISKSMNELQKDCNEVSKGIAESNKQLKKAGKELDQLNKLNFSYLKETNKELDKANKDINTNLNGAIQAMNKMNKGINQAVSGVTEVNSAISKTSKAMDKTSNALNNLDKFSTNTNYYYYTVKDGKTDTFKDLNKKSKELKHKEKKLNQLNVDVISYQKKSNVNTTALSLFFDVLPVVSNLKAAGDVIRGEDLITDKKISSVDRLLSGVSVVGSGYVKVAGKAVKNMEKAEKIEKQFQKGAKTAEEAGKFGGKIIAKNIPNMSKKEILDSLPTEWKYTEHNGFVHVRDTSGNIRMRIDPPDKMTKYDHVHLFDKNGNPLDKNLRIVDRKSPDAHIPYKK
ncbi:pre-toxin TG domain-containing protein [Bacillus atrophaeus]|uniref:pre-toxin TG domain-containing protein n=1 Tax=Bacillus atrophaeus TaxID=1452 RepID=UPI00255BB5E7|nr:pre-toxin TG domain-containing protein [Bacillus atrophaeus]MDL5140908.1 pre-toxin TG domain-containing protein [Bacillus atrophaeus]